MKKLIGLIAGFAVLLGGAVAYVVSVRHGGPAVNAVPVAPGQTLALDPSTLFFRNLADGPDRGKLAAVPAGDPGTARARSVICPATGSPQHGVRRSVCD